MESQDNDFAFFNDFYFSAGCFVQWLVAVVARDVRLGIRKGQGNSLATGTLDFEEVGVGSLYTSLEFVTLFKIRSARFARGRLRDRSPWF